MYSGRLSQNLCRTSQALRLCVDVELVQCRDECHKTSYILRMSQGFLDHKQWPVTSKQESSGVEESGSNAES